MFGRETKLLILLEPGAGTPTNRVRSLELLHSPKEACQEFELPGTDTNSRDSSKTGWKKRQC